MEATLPSGQTTASPTATGVPQLRPLQQPPARAPILMQGDSAVAVEAALCAVEDAAGEVVGRAFEIEWDLASTPTASRTPLSSEYR